jgi:ketosteroid isomerase-like protein
LVALTFVGHSRGAGVALERPSWFVVTVRNGRLVRTESYDSESRALEAAGIEN